MHRLPKYVDNKKDLDALLELRDIEDELGSIGKLFKDQHRSIADMVKHYQELNTKYNQGLNGTELLKEIKWTIDGYQEQLDEMLKSAQTAHKAVRNPDLSNEPALTLVIVHRSS